VHVTAETEVCGVENLVCAGVVEDSLGVDTGLVGEGTETGDGVVERCVDLYGLCHHIFDLLDHLKVVLALDVFGARDDHSSQEASEGSDAVTFSDS